MSQNFPPKFLSFAEAKAYAYAQALLTGDEHDIWADKENNATEYIVVADWGLVSEEDNLRFLARKFTANQDNAILWLKKQAKKERDNANHKPVS